MMANNLADSLVELDERVAIKNLHLVRDMQLFNNQQIFIVYDSMIHIHSISRLCNNLPSLLCVLDLQVVASKVEQSSYQDNLSHKIANSNKSSFGQIIFTQQLDPEKNALVSITHFKDRLCFLGSQFIRVHSLSIHAHGHIALTFEDKRCIILRRTKPSNYENISYSLYNTQQPILLNNALQSLVRQCIFTSNQQISLICLHTQQSNQQTTISKLMINDKNAIQIFAVAAKKPTLISKGIVKMQYVNNKNGCGWILLFYYNRLEIIQVGKNNVKNKNFNIVGHKQASLIQEIGSQHITKIFKYEMQTKEQNKIIKIFLVASSNIYQLQLNFKCTCEDNDSWNYKIIKKQRKSNNKTNIYYVNFKSDYLQEQIQKQNHPNFLLNLAAQTNNGLVIRLQASTGNYKEGYLFMACPNRIYMVQKMMRYLKQKLYGEREWVNFHDMVALKKRSNDKNYNDSYANLRRQILDEIKSIRQQNKKQAKNKNNKNEKSDSHDLINVLIINLLPYLKPQKKSVQELVDGAIQKHLKLDSIQKVDRSRCIITNKAITIQDVQVCLRCNLYNIMDGKNVSNCCYVCWNPLLKLQ